MARRPGGRSAAALILVFLAAVAAATSEDAATASRSVTTSNRPSEDSEGTGDGSERLDGSSRRVHQHGGTSPGSKPYEGHNKVTKYHYYPHNQHIYLLPECAIQQVCNAVYVRLNHTQPLCACPSRYKDPCSASLNTDDNHSMELMTDIRKKPLTMVKTCELTSEMRECRPPRDWSLLALQNIRTGKSHYLVICRCPQGSILEGPMTHDQPTYASVPGIRVYGMMCVKSNYWKTDAIPTRGRASRPMRLKRMALSSLTSKYMTSNAQRNQEGEDVLPPFPWNSVYHLVQHAQWEDTPR